jgi:hypothetical protein
MRRTNLFLRVERKRYAGHVIDLRLRIGSWAAGGSEDEHLIAETAQLFEGVP